jgi:3'-phosphoadenosine 5'-phosphosulfate sulfotransferase
MKKLIFILMVSVVALFAVNSVFADPAEDEAKALLQKNEDYFSDFQNKFKALGEYNQSNQAQENLKLMQTMIERQKKLIDFKIEEIEVRQRGGKTVPTKDFSQLKTLMDRYYQMNTDLATWVNGTAKK